MHFEGRANVWYRFYQASRGSVPWRVFVSDVVTRFENPENRDVQDIFNKLRQTGTVSEYEDQFEELRASAMSRNKGFNEELHHLGSPIRFRSQVIPPGRINNHIRGGLVAEP